MDINAILNVVLSHHRKQRTCLAVILLQQQQQQQPHQHLFLGPSTLVVASLKMVVLTLVPSWYQLARTRMVLVKDGVSQVSQQQQQQQH